MRNEKQKDPNATNYKILRVTVTYTNNSKDRVVTECFNKTIGHSCDFYVKEEVIEKYYETDEDDDDDDDDDYYYVEKKRKVTKEVTLGSHKRYGMKFPKVDKLNDIYPGQSWSTTYNVEIEMFKWKAEARKKFNTQNSFMKNSKWSHGFQVKSKGIADGKVYVE